MHASGALVFANEHTSLMVLYLSARCNKSLYSALLIKHKRLERRRTTILPRIRIVLTRYFLYFATIAHVVNNFMM